MTMTIQSINAETLRAMTIQERSAVTNGMLAAQNRQPARPPMDAVLASAYWSGFVAGGGKMPKKFEPKPERPAKTAAPKTEAIDGLREVLRTESGRRLIKWATEQALAELERNKSVRLSARFVWELARNRYVGAGMLGEWKVDNRLSAGWARWFLWGHPEFAHRIELRGPDAKLYAEGRVEAPWWFDPENPYIERPMAF
jgi:hypothetical protein